MEKNLAVIIPALNPDETLVRYTEELLEKGFKKIIIINDGSMPKLEGIFNQLNQRKQINVLKHEMNRGKGRALKTAFEYCMNLQELDGVITADADGQHHPDDVYRVARSFSETPEKIVLGTRDFNEAHVPKKSYLGNRLTSILFYSLFKKNLPDTQTGLRAIPAAQLQDLFLLNGERYEYEINMLIYAVKKKIELAEVPIRTIYYNQNAGSYYNAIKDSLRIFNQIIGGFFNFNKQFKKLNSEVYELNE